MNSPDPNRPETLTQVASEVEASAIVTALQAHGIEALAAGGFTSGFAPKLPAESRSSFDTRTWKRPA